MCYMCHLCLFWSTLLPSKSTKYDFLLLMSRKHWVLSFWPRILFLTWVEIVICERCSKIINGCVHNRCGSKDQNCWKHCFSGEYFILFTLGLCKDMIKWQCHNLMQKPVKIIPPNIQNVVRRACSSKSGNTVWCIFIMIFWSCLYFLSDIYLLQPIIWCEAKVAAG